MEFLSIAVPRIYLDVSGLDIESIKGNRQPFEEDEIMEIFNLGHYQFFEIIKKSEHFKLSPEQVMSIMNKAIDEKDTRTLEFMFRTMSEEEVLYLYRDQEWDCKDFVGLSFLDKSRFIDRFLSIIYKSKTVSDFDFLFEMYMNKRFSLSETKK